MTDTPAPHLSNMPDLTAELKAKHKPLIDRHAALKAKLAGITKIESDDDLETARAAVSDSTKLLGEAERARVAEKAPYAKAATDIDGLFNKELRDTLDGPKKTVADLVANFLNERRLAQIAEQRRLEAEAAAAAQKLQEEAQALEAEGRHREADTKLDAAVHQENLASQAAAQLERPASEASRVYTGGGTVSARTVKAIQSIDRASLDLNELRPFFKQEHLEDAVKAFMKTGRTDLKGAVFFDKPTATIR